MNKNAKKWVDALRSEDFHQAREVLRDEEGGYCCLGVACELYRCEVGGTWHDGDFETPNGRLMEDAELPSEVQKWLGLGDSGGIFKKEDGYTDSLIARNDTAGSSFAEIADIIEAEPKGLFA